MTRKPTKKSSARSASARRTASKKNGSYVGFNKLSAKLQSQGKSKKQADAIAASVSRKKYGSKGAAALSKMGRKKK